MKKIILNMLMLFAVTGVATAQTVTVADVEALPGETVKATLELTSPASKYTGIQFAIQFPATGFSIAATGAATGWPGLIEYNLSEGKYKFAASSSSYFEATNIDIEFTVDNSLALDEYDVTVTDIIFEGGSHKDPIADVPFKVIVTDRITLDENSTELPIERDGVNVKVKRTINANEWSTICLPFDMTESEVKAAFGNDVKLAYFTSYDFEKDGDNITNITINFEEDDLSEGFSKNYPYVIKTSKKITEFSLDGKNIAPDDAEESYSQGKGSNKKSGKFIGTYQASTEVPENSLFLSGNKFWYSTGATKMKAFRAYLKLDHVLTDKSAGARINVTDDETTGIKEVHGNANVDGTYDLQGRKVEEPTNKGLYIVNGHKVVIK